MSIEVKYAFTRDEFAAMLLNWGYHQYAVQKVCEVGNGAYIRVSDYKEYCKKVAEIKASGVSLAKILAFDGVYSKEI